MIERRALRKLYGFYFAQDYKTWGCNQQKQGHDNFKGVILLRIWRCKAANFTRTTETRHHDNFTGSISPKVWKCKAAYSRSKVMTIWRDPFCSGFEGVKVQNSLERLKQGYYDNFTGSILAKIWKCEAANDSTSKVIMTALRGLTPPKIWRCRAANFTIMIETRTPRSFYRIYSAQDLKMWSCKRQQKQDHNDDF